MDATIYFAIFIVGAFVLFGMFISWNNRLKIKNVQKKLFKEFEDFVIKTNLTIDKKQKANGNIIGIYRFNYKVVFFDSKERIFHLIDLTELQACRFIKERNRLNGHISKIYLQCVFSNKNTPPLVLPFYDAEHDSVYRMLRLAKKASYWESSINIYRKAAVLSEKITSRA